MLRVHDRLENKRHVGDVVVEAIEERHVDPQTEKVLQGSLRLQYEIAVAQGDSHGKAHGSFAAFYSEYDNHASLTSSSRGTGAVFLNLPSLAGQRVGSYLMNRLVLWLKEFPDAEVASIGLNAGQAGPENKERRNRFYEQFGIVFDYIEADRMAGRSRPMTVAMLKTVTNWTQNIQELTLDEYLRFVLGNARQQKWDIERLERVVADRGKEIVDHQARPFRWAMEHTLSKLWDRFAAPAFLLAVFLGILYMCYTGFHQLLS